MRTYLLLWVELLERLHALVALDVHTVAHLAACRRSDRADAAVFAVRARRAEKHTVALNATHGDRLQVTDADHPAIAHLVHRYKLDESRKNRARTIRLAKVDLLEVERVGVGVALDLHDLADTHIDHAWLRRCRLSCGSLALLLFRLFRGRCRRGRGLLLFLGLARNLGEALVRWLKRHDRRVELCTLGHMRHVRKVAHERWVCVLCSGWERRNNVVHRRKERIVCRGRHVAAEERARLELLVERLYR